MAEVKSNAKGIITEDERVTPRWKRILALPGDVWLKDLGSDFRFQRRQVIWSSQHEQDYCFKAPDFFEVRSAMDPGKTQEFHINHLRLLEDGYKCSLMGGKK